MGLKNPSGERVILKDSIVLNWENMPSDLFPLNDFHASLDSSDFTVSCALVSSRATYVVSCMGSNSRMPPLLELTWDSVG